MGEILVLQFFCPMLMIIASLIDSIAVYCMGENLFHKFGNNTWKNLQVKGSCMHEMGEIIIVYIFVQRNFLLYSILLAI